MSASNSSTAARTCARPHFALSSTPGDAWSVCIPLLKHYAAISLRCGCITKRTPPHERVFTRTRTCFENISTGLGHAVAFFFCMQSDNCSTGMQTCYRMPPTSVTSRPCAANALGDAGGNEVDGKRVSTTNTLHAWAGQEHHARQVCYGSEGRGADTEIFV